MTFGSEHIENISLYDQKFVISSRHQLYSLSATITKHQLVIKVAGRQSLVKVAVCIMALIPSLTYNIIVLCVVSISMCEIIPR